MKRLLTAALVAACGCAWAAVTTAHVPRHLKACVMQPPYALDVADIARDGASAVGTRAMGEAVCAALKQ